MIRPRKLDKAFFARPVLEVAPDLIGATFLFGGAGGVIVEVEAYHHTEPAAHSYRGRTERTAVMFGPPGHAYVYRSYGLHWCVNFVCEPEGSASAVLIRALEPTEGLAAMRERRCADGAHSDTRNCCRPPDRHHQGRRPPLALWPQGVALPQQAIPALIAATHSKWPCRFFCGNASGWRLHLSCKLDTRRASHVEPPS
jgi:hypothetical protein